jgi:hypothetical protein
MTRNAYDYEPITGPEAILAGALLDYMRKDTMCPDGPATNALFALLDVLGREDLDSEDREGVHALLVEEAQRWASEPSVAK